MHNWKLCEYVPLVHKHLGQEQESKYRKRFPVCPNTKKATHLVVQVRPWFFLLLAANNYWFFSHASSLHESAMWAQTCRKRWCCWECRWIRCHSHHKQTAPESDSTRLNNKVFRSAWDHLKKVQCHVVCVMKKIKPIYEINLLIMNCSSIRRC